MPAIDIASAVERAFEFVQRLYPAKDLRDLLLEEIELSEDGREWLVTVGFSLPKEAVPSLQIVPRAPERHYKVVRVDAQTGAPISMKIRELAHA